MDCKLGIVRDNPSQFGSGGRFIEPVDSFSYGASKDTAGEGEFILGAYIALQLYFTLPG